MTPMQREARENDMTPHDSLGNMPDDEFEAGMDAIRYIAVQAADKMLMLHGITEADMGDGWYNKIFDAETDLDIPGTPAILLWTWTGKTEDREIIFTVECRFGNLARGLYCDVVLSVAQPDQPLEAHHVEVAYPDAAIISSHGYIWPDNWWYLGLQDEDLKRVDVGSDPTVAVLAMEESVWVPAMKAIEAGQEQVYQKRRAEADD